MNPIQLVEPQGCQDNLQEGPQRENECMLDSRGARIHLAEAPEQTDRKIVRPVYDQGRLVRFYAPGTGRAYSAWQNENWVIIIEALGPFSQASPLAREVKEAVAEHYNQ